MKRAYRLRRPEQFRRVRREGRTIATPLLSLTVGVGRRRRTRCGIVVGKQIGGAVQRNRAKRRVREAVRLAFPAITPGYDLIFVVRSPKLSTIAFTELCALIEQVLRRAQIWRTPSEQTAVAAIEAPADGSLPPTER
jgi:ribonuclease P protein component